jgi:hypothetical protein
VGALKLGASSFVFGGLAYRVASIEYSTQSREQHLTNVVLTRRATEQINGREGKTATL